MQMNQQLNRFIPKIILIGNESDLPRDFPAKFEIVGRLDIVEISKDEIFFTLNGNRFDPRKLKYIQYDYLLCTDKKFKLKLAWMFYCEKFVPYGIFLTTDFFRYYVSNVGFIATDNSDAIVEVIRQMKNVNRILDADAYFIRGNIYDFSEKFSKSNQVSIDATLPCKMQVDSIFQNVYDQIFDSLDEIKLRFYDLILLTAERSLDEWISILEWANQSSREILAFIHEDSPMLSNFKKCPRIEFCKVLRGELMLIRNDQSKTCRAWISTHKKYFMPKLPDGYEWIHAGKKISKIDLGIRGDDTGDNISDLNLKINELTMHYWVWKNFQTDYVGFSHYRRYFVVPGDGEVMLGKNREHILTMNEAIDLLQDCDIIVDYSRVYFTPPQSEEFLAYQLVEKYLAKIHPEDLELFRRRIANPTIHAKSMFFTRWKVFDEYCRWMFSFIIPAAREFETSEPDFKRHIGFIAELMLTLFLIKHNLRVKNVKILEGANDSTVENFEPQNFYWNSKAFFI